MANLTRIKNNQITDSTIWANAKIIPGSIVGSLFNSNITVTSDFTITGNLTVQGAATYLTVASTNTYVNDPLIVLNNAFAGANQYDLGFIFNRGSSTNQAFYWDESSDEFKLIATSETGTTYGNIATETSYSNLRLGNVIVQYDASVKTLTATSTINTTGNILAATSIAQLHTGSTATFGNVAAVTVGNVGTQFNGAAINLSGNVLASTVYADLLTANDLTVGNVAAGFIGNTGTVYTGASINLSGNILSTGAVHNALTVNGATGISGNIIAGLAQFAAINSTPIGNATASSGAFTTLSAANSLWANASIATTTQGTGAIVVPNGGISVAGAANIALTATIGGATQLNNTLTVGGITTITNTTNTSPGAASGALQVQGGASINKDLWIGGNLYVSNVFSTSYTTLSVQDPLLYLTAANTYPYSYDIGIYSQFTGGVGNIYQHTGVVRDNADAYWKFFSNVATEPGSEITFDSTTKYDGVKAGNLVLTDTTTSTTTTTGALVVAGGAGIAGAINAASLNVSGNVLASAIIGAGLNVSGNVTTTEVNTGTLKATGLINTTGNVSAATVIAGQINTTGNVVASQVSTGTLNATGLINTLANVSAVVVNARNISTASAYGNIHLTQFASIFAEGNNAENQSIVQVSTTGLSDGMGIWAFTGASGKVYASRGIDFTTGATMRAQDTPTGGVTLVSINSTGHLFANATTDTTSVSTGAIVTAGGMAVGKTLWVGENAVFNSTQAAEDFRIYGQGGSTNNSLVYVNAAKNALVFGGANVSVQDGAVAKFNSDGAIVIPVGSSARRPGAAGNVDVAGMLRFSTTSNNLEFYDGADWQAAGSQFTVIATNNFSGNGVQVAYTLSDSATTAGTLVMVNGIVQIPVTAYSVSGTTLTFTEAPADGDAIDARTITTTAVVSSIASGDGYNTFDVATLPYANITAGTSSATVRVSVDGADGTFNIVNGTKTAYNQTVVSAPGTNLAQLDSFATGKYSTAKYIVQIKDGANIESAEVLLAQDTANVSITTYAVIAPAGALGTFSANIVSGSVKFWYTPTISTNANIKVKTDYIV